jgi:hypothetical protein
VVLGSWAMTKLLAGRGGKLAGWHAAGVVRLALTPRGAVVAAILPNRADAALVKLIVGELIMGLIFALALLREWRNETVERGLRIGRWSCGELNGRDSDCVAFFAVPRRAMEIEGRCFLPQLLFEHASPEQAFRTFRRRLATRLRSRRLRCGAHEAMELESRCCLPQLLSGHGPPARTCRTFRRQLVTRFRLGPFCVGARGAMLVEG